MEVVHPHADFTKWWACFFFDDLSMTPSFPGSTMNYSPWDFTPFFRLIKEAESETAAWQLRGVISVGDQVNVSGKLDAYKGAPVMFLAKSKVSVK